MGKSSRRNRPSKAQRKKNAITARNTNFYNTVHCKSTSKAVRAAVGKKGIVDPVLMNEFKKAGINSKTQCRSARSIFKSFKLDGLQHMEAPKN